MASTCPGSSVIAGPASWSSETSRYSPKPAAVSRRTTRRPSPPSIGPPSRASEACCGTSTSGSTQSCCGRSWHTNWSLWATRCAAWKSGHAELATGPEAPTPRGRGRCCGDRRLATPPTPVSASRTPARARPDRGNSRQHRQQPPDARLRHQPQHRTTVQRELGHAGHVQLRSLAERCLVERARALLVTNVEDDVQGSDHDRRAAERLPALTSAAAAPQRSTAPPTPDKRPRRAHRRSPARTRSSQPRRGATHRRRATR